MLVGCAVLGDYLVATVTATATCERATLSTALWGPGFELAAEGLAADRLGDLDAFGGPCRRRGVGCAVLCCEDQNCGGWDGDVMLRGAGRGTRRRLETSGPS